jgi:hypothetical protein
MASLVVPSYLLFAGLYAPWIIVPVAGISSILGQSLCGGTRTGEEGEGQS